MQAATALHTASQPAPVGAGGSRVSVLRTVLAAALGFGCGLSAFLDEALHTLAANPRAVPTGRTAG
jgi:hypothetical protein